MKRHNQVCIILLMMVLGVGCSRTPQPVKENSNNGIQEENADESSEAAVATMLLGALDFAATRYIGNMELSPVFRYNLKRLNPHLATISFTEDGIAAIDYEAHEPSIGILGFQMIIDLRDAFSGNKTVEMDHVETVSKVTWSGQEIAGKTEAVISVSVSGSLNIQSLDGGNLEVESLLLGKEYRLSINSFTDDIEVAGFDQVPDLYETDFIGKEKQITVENASDKPFIVTIFAGDTIIGKSDEVYPGEVYSIVLPKSALLANELVLTTDFDGGEARDYEVVFETRTVITPLAGDIVIYPIDVAHIVAYTP